MVYKHISVLAESDAAALSAVGFAVPASAVAVPTYHVVYRSPGFSVLSRILHHI